MKYRRLGRTGLNVSTVGVGTWQLSGEWGKRFAQHEVDALLGRAAALGVNLVDTAECYGDHLAEELVGEAIRGQRGDWIVATKFGHRFHEEAMQADGWSPGQVRTDHWTPGEAVAQLDRRCGRCAPTTWTSTSSIPARTTSLTETTFGGRCASR